MKTKTVKLFVEGGGDYNALETECRRAFNMFLKKAGLDGIMPRIVACGSRDNAYEDYCTAVNKGEDAVLLVDSEAPVLIPPDTGGDISSWKPWYHLKNHKSKEGELTDNWDMPETAKDTDCHLMVEVMESWFFADLEAMKTYYGNQFNEHSLPARLEIEEISKDQIFVSLYNATRNTQKGVYSKGNHSFDILSLIEPEKVMNRSPWAKRFIVLLTEKMREAR